jgi:hypothetical protein
VSRFSTLLTCAGAAMLVLAVLAVQISPVMNPPKWDEFIVVYDAHRVTVGQVPYRDFFNFIPPGVFLVLAATFKAAGASSLTVGRYVSSFGMIALFGLAAWAFRRRSWSGSASCLWAAVVPVALFGFWAVPSHHWMAAACAAGIVAAVGRGGALRSGEWFSAGLLTGLAGTFVQTAGVSLAAFCIVLTMMSLENRAKNTGALAAGVAAVWVPLLLAFFLMGAAPGFFRDVILWPAKNYARGGNENAGAALQDLPWRLSNLVATYKADPSAPRAIVTLAGFLLYAAVAVAALTMLAFCALSLFRVLRHRKIQDPMPVASLLAISLAVGLAARGNANWLHLIYLLALLGPLCLASTDPWSAWKPWCRVFATILLGLLIAAGALYQTRGLWVHVPEAWEWTDVDRPIRDQAVNRWLRTPGILAPGDTIAAFPEGGEVYLYAAPAAVGYTYFRPLVERYNSYEDHVAVAAQIEVKAPKFILVPPGMERDYMDLSSPVGRVMSARYERGATVGNAVIFHLRLTSSPVVASGGALQ